MFYISLKAAGRLEADKTQTSRSYKARFLATLTEMIPKTFWIQKKDNITFTSKKKMHLPICLQEPYPP